MPEEIEHFINDQLNSISNAPTFAFHTVNLNGRAAQAQTCKNAALVTYTTQSERQEISDTIPQCNRAAISS